MIITSDVFLSLKSLCQKREELRAKLGYVEFAEQERVFNSTISSVIRDVGYLYDIGSPVDDEFFLQNILALDWYTNTPFVSTE